MLSCFSLFLHIHLSLSLSPHPPSQLFPLCSLILYFAGCEREKGDVSAIDKQNTSVFQEVQNESVTVCMKVSKK